MKRYLKLPLVYFLLFLLVVNGKVGAFSNPSVFYKFPDAVTAIFIEGNDFIVGTDYGLYQSQDGGKNFNKRNTGLNDLYITGISKIGNTLFVGTRGGGLYSGNLDNGNWNSMKEKVDCPSITSIFVKEHSIFVTSSCTGFHASLDEGNKWFEVNGGLPTLRTTAYIKTPDGGNYLGTEEGLFYAGDINETTRWTSVLSDCSVNSLAYLEGLVFVGTDRGLFKGNKGRGFEKVGFIGGNPFVSTLSSDGTRLFVGFKDVGIYESTDGKNFFEITNGSILSPISLSPSLVLKGLFIGDSNGNLFLIDLSKPLLECSNEVEMEIISQGEKRGGSLSLFNLGYSNLSGTVINPPAFVKFATPNFSNNDTLYFTIDTTSLTPGPYSIPLKLSSNGGTKNVYLKFNVAAATSKKIILTVDSKTAYINTGKIELDAAPFIDKSSGRTLVPVRFISETFGASIEWDAASRKVTIRRDKTAHNPTVAIELWIGKSVAKVNSKDVILDVAPVIIPPGRTMVPLRFISEGFGSNVDWDAVNRKITITYLP